MSHFNYKVFNINFSIRYETQLIVKIPMNINSYESSILSIVLPKKKGLSIVNMCMTLGLMIGLLNPWLLLGPSHIFEQQNWWYWGEHEPATRLETDITVNI
jgi:hypothetical protein